MEPLGDLATGPGCFCHEPIPGDHMGRVASRLRALSTVASAVLVASLLMVIAPSVAHASDEASISGIVTAPPGVDLATASVFVAVHPAGDALSVAGTSRVGADGTYTVGGLAPGEYRVAFRGEGVDVASEWWDDTTEFAASDVLTLTAAEARDGVDATLAAGSAISGRVTADGGGAVSGGLGAFWVYAIPVGGGSEPWGPTVTSWGSPVAHDGTYTIDRLPAGAYSVQTRWGCECAATVGPYLDEFYLDAADVTAATPVSLGVGEVRGGVDFSLAPSALSGATPEISGTPRVGQTLTANAGTWTEGVAHSYQWFAGGTAISGATDPVITLTAAHLGRTIAVEVTGTKSGYDPVVMTSAPTAAVVAGILTAPTPTISGTQAVGSTLTAKVGTWTTGTTITYQWYANGAAIAGATAATLKLGTAHADKAITVKVTGRNSGYTTLTKSSAATAKIVTAATPSITGAAATGVKLAAAPNTWTPGTTLTYQWNADGVPISSATGSTFTPGAAQDGKAITVSVTGTKSGWASVTKTSKPTARVMRSSSPAVSGTVAYNSTLSVSRGTWSAGATFAYQWYADGIAIPGATASSLTLTSGLKDKRISVKVTGSRAGYTTVAKTSALTARVVTAATPSISGTVAVGSTLTAKTGTWTSGTAYSYQWYADGKAISGATGATYVPSSGTESKRITVTVTGRKSGYATVAKASAATAKVMRAGVAAVSGTAQVTKRLTVSPGTWTTGTSLSYQWYADGTAISGATASTLTLTSAQAGKTVVVKVTGRLTGYATVTKSSSATATVGYPSTTAPVDAWNCPSWAPIKGNADSGIYHMPGQRYYNATKPEACFRTETAAVNAGYRKSKV